MLGSRDALLPLYSNRNQSVEWKIPKFLKLESSVVLLYTWMVNVEWILCLIMTRRRTSQIHFKKLCVFLSFLILTNQNYLSVSVYCFLFLFEKIRGGFYGDSERQGSLMSYDRTNLWRVMRPLPTCHVSDFCSLNSSACMSVCFF